MKKLVAFGSDGTIFDLKPEESTFDSLLEKLGKGEESRKMQEEYLEKKGEGPFRFAERVKLFLGIPLAKIRKASKEYIAKKLRPDFKETILELKKRGYLVAILTSNPVVPYEILQHDLLQIDFGVSRSLTEQPLNFIVGTQLKEQNGICTGQYKPLVFPTDFKQWYQERYPFIKHWEAQEPNRYGLAQTLAHIVRDESIDAGHSWLIGSKVTKVPMTEIIKKVIVFGKADDALLATATQVIEGRVLKEVLKYVE